uniref:Uncharacterized protein n=1 Tax=Lotharella globosa TaxID=91324 RepID=A0A7S4DKB7_9EUKA
MHAPKSSRHVRDLADSRLVREFVCGKMQKNNDNDNVGNDIMTIRSLMRWQSPLPRHLRSARSIAFLLVFIDDLILLRCFLLGRLFGFSSEPGCKDCCSSSKDKQQGD